MGVWLSRLKRKNVSIIIVQTSEHTVSKRMRANSRKQHPWEAMSYKKEKRMVYR